MGTNVDVEALPEEYNELALDTVSKRLVFEVLGKPPRRNVAVEGVFPGEGNAGGALPSFSLDRVIFLGLNNFILDDLALGSLSGGATGLKLAGSGGAPGEGNGDLPFGKATFAAVVAANLLPPTEPLL